MNPLIESKPVNQIVNALLRRMQYVLDRILWRSAGLARSDIGAMDIDAKTSVITSLDGHAGICSIAFLRGMFDFRS